MNAPVREPGALRGVIVVPYGGFTPKVAADAFVAPGVVLVGDVVIESRANVWFGCVLRGDTGPIRVGARTNVQDMTMAHVDSAELPTLIGADVTIGHCVLLHACTLEDGAFVGMGATVMDGAVVEGGAMVAAGALVTPGKRVRRGELWGGSPAKPMRELRPDDLANFQRTVEHYAEKGADYKRIIAGGV
ncbi:MAG: gamma carbonic anhydrase family protein [Alphaproteobacteria bacterium]